MTSQDYALQLPRCASVADVRLQLHQLHGLAPWPGMKVRDCVTEWQQGET